MDSVEARSIGALVPEAWGWELEYLVSRLYDAVDRCKAYGCLLVSTNMEAAGVSVESQTVLYRRCVMSGGRVLKDYTIKKYPPIANGAPATFQTPTLVIMLHACCLGDINIGHIFDLIRINELLEHHTRPLSTREKATVLCAILGELHHVVQDLRKSDATSQRDQCISFISATLNSLLDFITEAGRDRATCMKQRFTRLPILPSQPQQVFLNDEDLPKTSVPHMQILEEAQADAHLHTLLLSGSLSSIWLRLEQLWSATGYRRADASTGRDDTVLPSDSALVQGIYNKIYWAVARAVRSMNRYRRILFTRVLEMLCSPLWSPSGSRLLPPKGAVLAVVNGFIDEVKKSKDPCWPYEAERQRSIVFQCPLIPPQLRQQLRGIIVIPDSAHFSIKSEQDTTAPSCPQLLAHHHRFDLHRDRFTQALRQLRLEQLL